MQHQAHTQVRGRHRRTDALHSHGAPAPPPATADEAAYRALLTSIDPLTAAGAAAPDTSATPSADAYRALLASDAPLAGPPVGADGNRAARRANHRARRKPIAPALLGESARNAVITAALVAGVSVAGISAAAAGAARADAAQAGTRTATHTGFSTPAPPASTTTGGTSYAQSVYAQSVETEAPESTPALAYVRGQRKVNPVSTAKWVNPMPDGAVTSCFGERWGRLHAGVDLATTAGTPIRAVGAGIVVTAGPAQGYGNAVLIDHGNGYLTHYGHMSVITVTAGQHLEVGEQIGTEGSTGHSTGPHLHFEVHEGTYKNPIEPTRWLHDHGVDIPGCATDADHTDG